MPLLIQYLIKLSISLSVVWLFYQLVLRRLTFYNWNRWFLLGYSILAFLIPLIDISPVLEKSVLVDHKVVQFIPVVDKLTSTEENLSFTKWEWTVMLFASGCCLLFLRLLIQHVSFLKLRRSAELISGGPVKVYHVNHHIIPFSFGDEIFINPLQHSAEDLREIITHEFVHVRQKHSVDMLCAEWLCIFNWYNPFAWLIRKAIRQNLEFIADNKVVQNGIDKKYYQYLLLKVIGVPQYSIATNFNFSSLKKRIAMMNKVKTAKVHVTRFLFVLPLIAAMLLAFRNRISNLQNTSGVVTETGAQDTIPASKKDTASKYGIKITVTSKDGKKEEYDLDNSEQKAAFERRHGKVPSVPAGLEMYTDVAPPVSPKPSTVPRLPENVTSISINNQKAAVKLKNGKLEKYDLSKPEQRDAFQSKYGAMPEPPVPPAPPLPDDLESSSRVDLQAPPLPPTPFTPPVVENSRAILPPAVPGPPVVPALPANVLSIHVNNQNATIKLKDGTVEKYDLSKPDEKEAFKKKYGDVTPSPPQVPPAPVEPSAKSKKTVAPVHTLAASFR